MTEPDIGVAVLIADDDPVVLSALAMGLASMGYRVVKAASGEEAVYQCLQQKPAIAVLDINMPGISGIEAARQIRETSGVPVMFLSAYDDHALVTQAVAEGGLGYLVKPVRINQLVPAIQAALARAGERGALEGERRHLTQALEGDRNINVAMGILMERHRLGKGAAFDLLRQRARAEGRKIGDLAQEVIAAAELLNGFAGDFGFARRKTDRSA
ncbi:MAG: response regulator [Gammaproteobacteria bacterium]|nr:response regulator [Gammaproteobacteria bacterium]MBU1646265.1 response regulator [Gammaproteobacteria bacterium]MBU1971191.1 response regulator [Gammaproteobacteria bacterium]